MNHISRTSRISGPRETGKLTESCTICDNQLATNGNIFKGRNVEHLASKGSQVPGAIISGLEHVCDDWDEALRNMPTPQITPETFVTIETFRGTVETWKWIIAGICGVTVSTFGLLFAWIYPVIGVKAVLEKHIEDDEKRHAELVVQLGQEHRENQERLVTMRADLAAGQQTMRSELVSGHQVTLLEIHRLGDLLNRYILRDREI